MKKISIVLVLFVAVAFIACKNSSKHAHEGHSHDHDHGHEHEQKATESDDDCADVHWSHKPGTDGPENWKDLCPGFADCGGKAQSPINIVTADAIKEDKLTELDINYSLSPTEIINNGHTVQFNISGNHTLTLGEKVYKLVQFHYHAHSEHAIDGEYFPLEVHFVHKYADDDLAVVGLMITPGESYEVFNKNLDSLPDVGGTYSPNYTIDLSHLNAHKPAYYYYKGSLTTPPCSEIVSWVVLKDPLEASQEQIEELAELLHNDFRPALPLNDRTVYHFGE